MSEDLFKKSFPLLALFALCALLIVGISMWVGEGDKDKEVELVDDTATSLPAPLTADELAAYDVDITNDDNPVAVITTNKGVIELELFDDTMPITAGNFAKLAKEGFYNQTKFHRVIEGFMIQGGDPLTKADDVLKYGSGGPGYSIPDEHVEGTYLSNVRGTIAMANSGPNSGGSQFFINLVDNIALDFNVPDANNSAHPVFGRVIKGMEVVDAIGQIETNRANNLPLDPVIVEKVEIKNQ